MRSSRKRSAGARRIAVRPGSTDVGAAPVGPHEGGAEGVRGVRREHEGAGSAAGGGQGRGRGGGGPAGAAGAGYQNGAHGV